MEHKKRVLFCARAIALEARWRRPCCVTWGEIDSMCSVRALIRRECIREQSS
jgi:hypothetical protein